MTKDAYDEKDIDDLVKRLGEVASDIANKRGMNDEDAVGFAISGAINLMGKHLLKIYGDDTVALMNTTRRISNSLEKAVAANALARRVGGDVVASLLAGADKQNGDIDTVFEATDTEYDVCKCSKCVAWVDECMTADPRHNSQVIDEAIKSLVSRFSVTEAKRIVRTCCINKGDLPSILTMAAADASEEQLLNAAYGVGVN